MEFGYEPRSPQPVHVLYQLVILFYAPHSTLVEEQHHNEQEDIIRRRESHIGSISSLDEEQQQCHPYYNKQLIQLANSELQFSVLEGKNCQHTIGARDDESGKQRPHPVFTVSTNARRR